MEVKHPTMYNMYEQRIFGALMNQTFTALYVFEWILNNYNFDYIVEFGTGRGGLSTFLAMQAQLRGLKFVTFDARFQQDDDINFKMKNPPMSISRYLKQYYETANIFSIQTTNKIAEIMRNNLTFTYCDNGDKNKEVNTFAPFITSGSVIGCHDWHGGFDTEKIEKDYNLEIIFDDFCKEYKTRQRFWYKP